MGLLDLVIVTGGLGAISGGSKVLRSLSSARGGANRERQPALAAEMVMSQVRARARQWPVGRGNRNGDAVSGRKGMGDVVKLDCRRCGLARHQCFCMFMAVAMREIEEPDRNSCRAPVWPDIVQPGAHKCLRLVGGKTPDARGVRRGFRPPLRGLGDEDQRTAIILALVGRPFRIAAIAAHLACGGCRPRAASRSKPFQPHPLFGQPAAAVEIMAPASIRGEGQ